MFSGNAAFIFLHELKERRVGLLTQMQKILSRTRRILGLHDIHMHVAVAQMTKEIN